ncbi:MAG: CRISPR-associated protein Csx20 [Campylobacter sp.]|nr:CRISPR-associated protein Csx20 [Campylobacter sp.]
MRMFLFFSHSLNKDQINDAKLNLKVDEFIKLEPNLQTLFSNVSPEIANLSDFAKPFLELLDKTAKKGDYALIQGRLWTLLYPYKLLLKTRVNSCLFHNKKRC